MINREELETKMRERGFVYYSDENEIIVFISEIADDPNYDVNILKRNQAPVISITVDLEADTFFCTYHLRCSFNTLNSHKANSVMDDKYFDHVVSVFETEAKWMEKLYK